MAKEAIKLIITLELDRVVSCKIVTDLLFLHHSLYLSSDDMMMSCLEQKQELVSFEFNISNKVYQQTFNKKQQKGYVNQFAKHY